MVRLDKLLDAWRADPRVEATVELGNMLLRANTRARGALPRTFVVEFGDDAAQRHGAEIAVLDVLARLFAVSDEGARAQALYARAASLSPGDARVPAIEAALRAAGLAVPPPGVAARLAPRSPEHAARSEHAPPRPAATSLADFAPAAGAVRPFPIDGSLLDEALPPAAPDHVREAPTREMSSEGIERALEEASRPRRARAPTVAGLGVPPLASPPDGAALRPPPARRNRTLVPEAGAVPPAGSPLPRVAPLPAAPGTGLRMDAGVARMFTPVRAFTPPRGGPAWGGVSPDAARPPGRFGGADEPSEGDTATGVVQPEWRRQAIIDNPTTTQESKTHPLLVAPPRDDEGSGAAPTRRRLVPEEAQLRAAAASLAAGRPQEAGRQPDARARSGGEPASPRPAARRAVPMRERRPIPEGDDDAATGVTSTAVAAPPRPEAAPLATPARAARVDDRREPDDGGPATARRDTSELLAAALRPPDPRAAPALGSPSAAATAPNPPVAPPPVRAPLASSPEGSPTRALRAPGVSTAPAVKPTLVSRGAPQAKPTRVSPGAQPGAPQPAEEPSHTDDVDTRVRPLAPPAPPHVKATLSTRPPAAAPSMPSPVTNAAFAAEPSSTFSRAITGVWNPDDGPPGSGPAHPASPAGRREADDEGPSTNVITSQPAGSRDADAPSAEELELDALLAVEEPGPPGGGAPLHGAARTVRSTQRLAGTVSPAVVWSPPDPGSHDDAVFGGVRTKVLTVEESAEAGRVDPFPPATGETWMITPPPPTAPRFGSPPATLPPGDGTPGASGAPRSLAPTFGPPSMVPAPFGSSPGVAGASPPRSMTSPVVLGSIVGVALSLLVAGGAWLYDELSQPSTTTAEPVAAAIDLDALVLVGRRTELDRVDAALREPAPSSAAKARAMTRLRERSLRALELGAVTGLDDAIRDARDAGWGEGEVAFAQLAQAVTARDRDAASAVERRWSGERSTDAWLMLGLGAAAEQRGDRKALETYGAALGLEPRLRPAALRVARAELLEGSDERGNARLEALAASDPTSPEVAALRHLAWLRARRGPSAPPPPSGPPPSADQLPVELRFVPAAVRLATGAVPAGERKSALDAAVGSADVPAVAVLLGELAFDLRLEATAVDVARAELLAQPTYAPALHLFGKSALALAKLDLVGEVARKLPPPQQTLLRAVAAYERGDVEAVAEARAWLGDRDEPGREGIVARAERLVGKKPMPDERIRALQRPGVVGGDLVAVDALLDAGDLQPARTIVDGWGDVTSHPLRALRAARLLRYEGKLREADAALDAALPTSPTTIERVLLDAETPARRAHALGSLDARLGADRPLYEAYLLGRDGKTPAARKILDRVELPAEDAPLARRIAASLALAAVGDEERGRDRTRRLLADWPAHPDVVRAARIATGGARPPELPPPRGKSPADRRRGR